MTKSQIAHLKLLGYEETQEDGAILEHKLMAGSNGFVWKGAKFDSVLANFTNNFTRGYLKRLVNSIVSKL